MFIQAEKDSSEMSEIIESLDDSLIVIEDSSKEVDRKALELNSAVQETVSASRAD